MQPYLIIIDWLIAFYLNTDSKRDCFIFSKHLSSVILK